MSAAPGRRDTFGAAIVAALIALALAFGAQRGRHATPAAARDGSVTTLAGPLARVTVHPTTGRLEITTIDGASRLDLEMSLMMDPASDLFTASLAVAADTGSASHAYALRLSFAPEGRTVFMPGASEAGGPATIHATSLVLDDDVHPFAMTSTLGPLAITEQPADTEQPGARRRLAVSARSESASRTRLDMSVLVGASSQQIWGRLYRLLHREVARVSGVVSNASSEPRSRSPAVVSMAR